MRSARPTRFLRILMLVLTAAILLVVAAPAYAARQPSDLQVSGEVIASNGDQRTIRVTLTNLGPGIADAQGSGEQFPGEAPFGFEVSLQMEGIEAISYPSNCRVAEGIFPTVYCYLGDRMAVGESRHADYVVRVLPGTTQAFAGSSSNSWSDDADVYSDPDPANNVTNITWSQPRTASSLTLRIGRKTARLDAIGALRPAHPGEKVLVKLTRNGKLVSKKNVTLAINSVYAVSFKRPTSGTCKVKVTFAGDRDHLPSSKTKGFLC